MDRQNRSEQGVYNNRLSGYRICDTYIRDETIRSSHDTIRIDTKGDDMVIFDTIRYGL